MSTIRVGLSPEVAKVIPGFVPAEFSFCPLHISIWFSTEEIPGGKLVTGDLKPLFVSSTRNAILSLIRVLENYPDVENAPPLGVLHSLLAEYKDF